MAKKTTAAKKQRQNTQNKPSVGIEPRSQYPVVGIGASAGGLEAFEAFFSAMPDDAGIAIILVAHLAPSHISILPEILQKKTKMKVSQVNDNITISPNEVYIIPPNKEMVIFNRTLQLMEMSKPRGANMPIDIFFQSLAEDQGNKAIGIILSGTGTDGTLGIRAIKDQAGMVMVQDVDSAKYDGMPRSAISTGIVDYIERPEAMARKLTDYLRNKIFKQERPVVFEDKETDASLQKIFAMLRASTKYDFSMYKKNTIYRRIERRMHVHRIDKLTDYVRYLRESDRELSVLFKDLLIGVTNFFRDSEAYELLKNKHLPEILKDKPNDYQVRIWVPGCSSGEEAYTVAIIVQECMENMKCHFSVQIFATDIDEDAINVARSGIYPKSISADLTQERLKTFFTKDGNEFRVNKNIREMVVFAQQNIIKDPPFTKLDMLCCRNLLIYFEPELQKRVLPIFRYSLKNDGLLFLGTSESIGQTTDLFTCVDKKWKIFKPHPSEKPAYPILDFPVAGPMARTHDQEDNSPLGLLNEVNTLKLLKAILAQSGLPACVVIDEMANITYIHGRTGRFLEPAEGESSFNIIDMARPGLKAGLTNAIRKVTSTRQAISIKGLEVKENGGFVKVNLRVKPLPGLKTGRPGMMMIIFDEIISHSEDETLTSSETVKSKKSDDAQRLADELQYTRENLQTTIEELETSNEELKSTNEELQSTNEELQSTNEELETSREELQSLNEETVTVNSELQSRIDELVAANDDIKNLLDATRIATIFLDINFNIRRFTPKVTSFFHLTGSDIGRPIDHFATTLKNVRLRECSKKVLQDLERYETEVDDDSGKRYRMRVRPYRTMNNVIDGVVITFEDVTEHKQVLEALTESEDKWRGLVEHAPMGIFIITNNQFSYLNPAAVELFAAQSEDDMLGKPMIDRVPQDCHDIIAKRIATVINERKPIPAIDEEWLRLDGTLSELVVSAAPIVYNGQNSALIFARKKL